MKLSIMVIDMIKKIRLFFVVMIFVCSASAMKEQKDSELRPLDPNLLKKNYPKIFISRKESKFDTFTLKQLSLWYNELSDLKKESIKKNLSIQDKSQKALFYFIHVPKELQEKILLYTFNNNQTVTNLFYTMPLCRSINNYAIAKKIWDYREENTPLNTLLLAKDENFTIEVIFEHVKSFVVFDKLLNDEHNKPCLNKKELESLVKIIDKFEGSYSESGKIKYKYHTDTLENFEKEQFKFDQWVLLPFFYAPFVSQLISHYCVFEWLFEYEIAHNECKECLNLFLKNKYQETGNELFLSYTQKVINTAYIKDIIFLLKGIIYCSAVPLANYVGQKRSKLSTLGYLGDCVFVGLISWGMKAIALRLMPSLVQPLLERSLASIAIITVLYALVVGLYNKDKLRAIRFEEVELKDLSELLKRTDIVIE